MITLYKEHQVQLISTNLGISKTTVKTILDEYVAYIKGKLDMGEPVKFLNVVKFRVDKQDVQIHETLAYTSTEMAKKLKLSSVVVSRVLLCFEEMILEDIINGLAYNVRGLFTLKLDGGVLSLKKSFIYNNYDIRAMVVGSFKRKVKEKVA